MFRRGVGWLIDINMPSAWQVYHPLESKFVLKVRCSVQTLVATEEGEGTGQGQLSRRGLELCLGG